MTGSRTFLPWLLLASASKVCCCSGFVVPATAASSRSPRRIIPIRQSDTTNNIITSSSSSCSSRSTLCHPNNFYGRRSTSSLSSSSHSTSSTNSNSNTNYGVDMNQEDMMESDMLVTVDQNDVLVDATSTISKKLAHTFNQDQPRGILHRAFSFFLFNDNNQMLLTRRAKSKITFPGVWTNTCCSHPLHGMTPNEVDIVPDSYPGFPGIKHAATRKLKHELGIEPQYVPHDKITFLSRFHYWAADTITYGTEAPWGEHEVDYILFFKLPKGVVEDLPLHPCPDEVEEYKYVSIRELKEMMKNPNLLWSPWFLGIMERGGFDWWQDMEGSLAGKNTNANVEFFDPPPEHVAAYNKPTHGRQTGVLLPAGGRPGGGGTLQQ